MKMSRHEKSIRERLAAVLEQIAAVDLRQQQIDREIDGLYAVKSMLDELLETPREAADQDESADG